MDPGLLGLSLGILTLVCGYLMGAIREIRAVSIMAEESLKRSIDAAILVKAIEKSTHTLIPVHSGPNGLDAGDMDKKLRSMAGLANEDFTSDLKRAGMDLGDDEIEGMV